jgi:hypothetical protein
MKRVLGAMLVVFLTGVLSGCGDKQSVKESHSVSTPTGEKTVDKETTVKTNSDGTKVETKQEVKTTDVKK